MGIWRDDQLLGPTAAQQRSVLAMLLLEPGRVVSVDRLVMAVWGEDPPGSARNAVQVQISKLRRILAALPEAELTTSAKGYCLTAPRAAVDLHRFRDLVREARAEHDDRAAELLRAALQLWRGPALADVAGDWLSDTVGAGLEEERRAAVEECAAIDVRAGRHHEAVTQLSALVAEHPLRERSVALLMEALCRSGRRVDALALFRATRQRYAEELGIEPGEELQRLHRQALDTRSGFGPGAGASFGAGPGAGYEPGNRAGSGAGGVAGGRAGAGTGYEPEPGGRAESGAGRGAGQTAGGRAGAEAGYASGAGYEPGDRTESGAGYDPGAGQEPGGRTAPEAGYESAAGYEPGDRAGAGAGCAAEPGTALGAAGAGGCAAGSGTAAGDRVAAGAGYEPGVGYAPGGRAGAGAGCAAEPGTALGAAGAGGCAAGSGTAAG
ncbi:BTAD domain-containing putative transcriptional regulator, partial [Streptomyces sp. NPDC021212]|uniref:AfsR/SARP family transcriptional regulator n=1 Tax=Streptomyces sp. NPDC021212 TaxID=3365118 RepID=UPI0037A04609